MFKKAQQSVAHQSKLPSSFGLGNRDLKALQEVITTEKDFIKSNNRSAQDFHKVADSIKTWADSEGEDLQDVVGKLSLLLEHYTTAQTRFNAHLSTIRQHFKSIRTREESLADLKSRKKSLGFKIEGVEKKLAKMGPENKELMKTTTLLKELRVEMESMRVEVQAEEAAIGDFKRRTSKEALGIKCGGLLEFAEKMTIVAEIGKMMIEEIPLEYTHPGMPRAEYLGAQRTDQLLQEATRSLADVGFAPAGPSAGINRQDLSGMRGSEWDDSGMQQDHRSHSHEDGGDEPYEANYQVDSEAPHLDDVETTTPIYATHSSMGRIRGDSLPPNTAATDPVTDEWRGASASRDTETYRARPSTSTPIADQFASRSPDEVQVGATGLSVVGAPAAGQDSTNDSFSRRAAREEFDNDLPSLPPPVAHANGLGHSAGPPRIATPTLQESGTHTPERYGTPSYNAMPASPAVVTPSAQDDASYFQAVGSTRAAQQAVRRPISPSNSSFHASNSISSHLAANSGVPSSPYEPQAEGRKMTAAAFRKGFNRNPSSQQMGASSSNMGHGGTQSADAPYGSGGHEDGGGTAPLSVRKRYSAVPGQSAAGGSDEHPAPPYDETDRHASVYGGYEEPANAKPESSSRPIPGQYYVPSPYGNNNNNSRPTSAAGWRATSGNHGS